MKKIVLALACMVAVPLGASPRQFIAKVLHDGGGYRVTPTPGLIASSCEQGPVQAVLTAAQSVTAPVVAIPAGTCEWTTQVTFTAPANSIIEGYGTSTAVGGDAQTIIVDRYNASAAPWAITTNASGTLRLTNISFKGGAISGFTGDKTHGLSVEWSGTSTQVRIDHNTFNNTTYSGFTTSGVALNVMRFYGCVKGVIDQNYVTMGSSNAFDIFADGCTDGNGDAAWNAATGFGDGNPSSFLYWEDNYLTASSGFGGFGDCSHGGKFVARFNTGANGASFQTHGTGAAGGARGCRASEIYGNTMTGGSGEYFNIFSLTSGPSLVWGNDAGTNRFDNFITIHSERRNANTYTESATPAGWGYCGTSFNGTGSNWDRNDSAVTGYYCLDQPGRGLGDLLASDFPTRVNSTRGGIIEHPHQALEPVYEWNNTWACPTCGGTGAAHNLINAYEGDVLVDSVDYYRQDTGGTATGTSLPGTCTTGSETGGGQAYWKTNAGGDWNTASSGVGAAFNLGSNDGALYKCTATNTWTLYYTPYTYPHPLRAGG